MIDRERLQELINQKAKIWYYDKEDYEYDLMELDTKNISFSYGENCFINFNQETWKTNPQPYKIFEDCLYETQAEAEWVAKMHTKRTEYFEPPTWEEFEKQGEPYYFIGKGGIKERIYIYNNNGIRKLLSSGCKFWGTPTKENYIKACEYARNLFLGKENENETDSDR